MARVYLGLGSNLGDRLSFLRNAVSRIAGLPATRVVEASGVYESEPFGVRDQPDFLNAVIAIETAMGPDELHRQMKAIERSVGRKPGQKWGPREIDIDILFFQSEIIRTAELTIPHPGAARRKFVLEPLKELSPEFLDPETGRSVVELLQQCDDNGQIRKLSESLLASEES